LYRIPKLLAAQPCLVQGKVEDRRKLAWCLLHYESGEVSSKWAANHLQIPQVDSSSSTKSSKRPDKHYFYRLNVCLFGLLLRDLRSTRIKIGKVSKIMNYSLLGSVSNICVDRAKCGNSTAWSVHRLAKSRTRVQIPVTALSIIPVYASVAKLRGLQNH
jgi:hypothetical protein